MFYILSLCMLNFFSPVRNSWLFYPLTPLGLRAEASVFPALFSFRGFLPFTIPFSFRVLTTTLSFCKNLLFDVLQRRSESEAYTPLQFCSKSVAQPLPVFKTLFIFRGLVFVQNPWLLSSIFCGLCVFIFHIFFFL